jgi:hypothetical protein
MTLGEDYNVAATRSSALNTVVQRGLKTPVEEAKGSGEAQPMMVSVRIEITTKTRLGTLSQALI